MTLRKAAARRSGAGAPATGTTNAVTTSAPVAGPHLARAKPASSVSILDSLPVETVIPSLLVLLLASVSFTLMNAIFNVLAQRDRSVSDTFRQWSRVLWMSRAAHIVEAPSAEEAHRMTRHRHLVTVTEDTSPTMMSPVELYDSAAFFRGLAAPSTAAPTGAEAMPAYGSLNAATTGSRARTPLPMSGHGANTAATAAAFGGHPTAATPLVTEMAVYHAEHPPASVPAPVVAEALTNTMEAVRLESQRLIFAFHPYYIILCSIKACVMLLYIQYHFDAIEGGWRRFCICGAASVFSGLLTPVWEYCCLLLLPLDPDRAQPAVVKVDEEKTDSVFIVEVLLRIGSLELDDLPTVLMQGSTFVAFAAVLVPLFVVFCLRGMLHYIWLYAPLWIVYAVVRHLYYRGAGALPSPSTRSAAAVIGMTTEMLKAFFMKAFTFFVLLATIQTSLVLGLARAEKMEYHEALDYAVLHQLNFHRVLATTTFQKACLLSQLFL